MTPTRYLVRARGTGPAAEQALDAFMAFIRKASDLALLDAIGPPGHPHTLVIGVPPGQVGTYEPQFHEWRDLIIEPDRPLSMFGERP
jgi:hypothetical protein